MVTDIFAGACAGIAQVAVGHPLDTIKVHLQNKYPLPKFKLLYRGYRYPLVYALAYNSLIFPIVTRSSLPEYQSGFLAGMAVTPLAFFFDLCKVKRQTQQPIGTHLLWHRGFRMAFLRETIAMSAYFSSYYELKNHIKPLYAGGLAGLINWTLTYPIDVIRNRQFAQNCVIREAIRQRNFWRGYSFCALRAVLVNTAIFATYEFVDSS